MPRNPDIPFEGKPEETREHNVPEKIFHRFTDQSSEDRTKYPLFKHLFEKNDNRLTRRNIRPEKERPIENLRLEKDPQLEQRFPEPRIIEGLRIELRRERVFLADPQQPDWLILDPTAAHSTVEGPITGRGQTEGLPFTGMRIEDQYRELEETGIRFLPEADFQRRINELPPELRRYFEEKIDPTVDYGRQRLLNNRLFERVEQIQRITPETDEPLLFDFRRSAGQEPEDFSLAISEEKTELVQAPHDADITPDEAFGEDYWSGVDYYGRSNPNAMQQLSDYQREQSIQPEGETAEGIVRGTIQADIDPTENEN